MNVFKLEYFRCCPAYDLNNRNKLNKNLIELCYVVLLLMHQATAPSIQYRFLRSQVDRYGLRMRSFTAVYQGVRVGEGEGVSVWMGWYVQCFMLEYESWRHGHLHTRDSIRKLEL